MTKSMLKKMPSKFPKMIVFDLDYTLWPDWIDCTNGPPYTYDESTNAVVNTTGEYLGFFEHTADIIALIKSFPDTQIGIASRTQTPEWAKKAIGLLRIPGLDNTPLVENVDYLEIYPGSKLKHFKSLSEKSGISCSDMLFLTMKAEIERFASWEFILFMSTHELVLHRFNSRMRYMHLLQIQVQSKPKWTDSLLQRVK
ncbi:acid phosphatase-domain-containing protein [Mucor lusitanicus]